MADYRHFVITHIFYDYYLLMGRGIFLSGQEERGEYKQWDSKGSLRIHTWYNKDGKIDGQRKDWWSDKIRNNWYDNGEIVSAPSWKFKKGYILDGEGHYHKD